VKYRLVLYRGERMQARISETRITLRSQSGKVFEIDEATYVKARRAMLAEVGLDPSVSCLTDPGQRRVR
jgi:hypothetical protein